MVHSNARMRFGKVSNHVVISAGGLNETPGGNEALPPRWQLNEGRGHVRYQDKNLMMISRNRPLPGARLGEPRECYHGKVLTVEHR